MLISYRGIYRSALARSTNGEREENTLRQNGSTGGFDQGDIEKWIEEQKVTLRTS